MHEPDSVGYSSGCGQAEMPQAEIFDERQVVAPALNSGSKPKVVGNTCRQATVIRSDSATLLITFALYAAHAVITAIELP